MKKTYLCSLFVIGSLLFQSLDGFCQFNPYDNKPFIFGAGIGISGYGVPIYTMLDLAIADNITVGGGIAYQTNTESAFSSLASVKWRHNIFSIVARGNYHFNEILDLPDQWDLYGGVGLGYYIWNTKLSEGSSGVSYSGSGSGGLGVSVRAGGRYFFNEKIAANAELGGGSILSAARVGVTVLF